MSELDTAKLYQELGESFPKAALKQRQVDGKNFTYVDGTAVIRRLNHIAPGWSNKIGPITRTPHGKTARGADKELLMATVSVTIPGLGTREHIGVQVVVVGGGEDLFKGVITDGIKKAATLFGVALDLYGPDYEDYDDTPSYGLNNRDLPPMQVRAPKNNRITTYQPTPAELAQVLPPKPPAADKERSPGGASYKSLNMLYGSVKRAGHIVRDPQGNDHHDESWLMQFAYESDELTPNQLTPEDLTQAQVSRLIDLLKPDTKGEPERHPGISPENYAPNGKYGWNEFWPYARSVGAGNKAEFERMTGEKVDGKTPEQCRDLITRAMERQPQFLNNLTAS